MAKSKTRKDHKKKVAARNAKIKEQSNKYYSAQKAALMKLIEEEKKKGMFDTPISIDGPQVFDGPSI